MKKPRASLQRARIYDEIFLTEKIIDTTILKLINFFFFSTHHSRKIGTNCLKLGSNGQISIIRVEANSTRPRQLYVTRPTSFFMRGSFLKISTLIKMCIIKTRVKFRVDQHANLIFMIQPPLRKKKESIFQLFKITQLTIYWSMDTASFLGDKRYKMARKPRTKQKK